MTSHDKIMLPALRGVMGEWAYYSCLMPLKELQSRVQFAHELHRHKGLSELIQRELKDARAKGIVEYLLNQKERFFSSLVVAVYKGKPTWYEFGDIRPTHSGIDMSLVSEDAKSSLGFLSFTGKETLFALDGQHRLAGLKRLFEDKTYKTKDEVSVLFVAHDASTKGMQKTRRLFTTLNKKAKPVSTSETIALDEDDTMAITVRRLLEEERMFSNERIAIVGEKNLPPTNKSSFTTIVALYDVLYTLFLKVNSPLRRPRKELENTRLPDDELDEYFKFAMSYFTLLSRHFSEFRAFAKTRDFGRVVKRYRNERGGKVIYRPIGLDLITEIVAEITNKDVPLHEAVRQASKLPRNLTDEPFLGLMWDMSGRITNDNLRLLRDICLYMLGYTTKKPYKELLKEYRRALDDERAALPRPIR